jgi:hypothetical protein
MPNDVARAEFWKSFLLSRCHYPAPDRLETHLAAAVPHDFCPCGCNSFSTTISSDTSVPPLTLPGRYSSLFEAGFRLSDGRLLEVLLIADEDGNLAGIDIECEWNAEPVPDEITLADEPFYVWASKDLIRP